MACELSKELGKGGLEMHDLFIILFSSVKSNEGIQLNTTVNEQGSKEGSVIAKAID